MAAGLGFKTFTTGEVLTAADVNGYLMQGVLVFATEAARNSAITSPQEGQFAFTKDTNSLWYYSGVAWVASGATGDIEGVTAGVGISGGGTSGTVTITNDMATTITASGDIVVGTGSGTYDNLPIGSTGQVLTADTTVSPYKVKWATPAGGGGKVLQVVSADITTLLSTTSTSYTDSNITLNITPSSATSKVLAIVTMNFRADSTSGGEIIVSAQLLRGATVIGTAGQIGGYEISSTASFNNFYQSASYTNLDSPSTTSATTYKIQVKINSAANGRTLRMQSNGPSSITLLEIGA
jgi:hypothetical protein